MNETSSRRKLSSSDSASNQTSSNKTSSRQSSRQAPVKFYGYVVQGFVSAASVVQSFLRNSAYMQEAKWLADKIQPTRPRIVGHSQNQIIGGVFMNQVRAPLSALSSYCDPSTPLTSKLTACSTILQQQSQSTTTAGEVSISRDGLFMYSSSFATRAGFPIWSDWRWC